MPPLSPPEASSLWPPRWEFPEGASQPPGEVSRRDFLKVASASLAAVGLGGCLRRSQDHIVPYVHAPEHLVPGVAQHYASAIPRYGYARGILVESHEGRPTKIEGNPAHPESLGSTDAITQASIWDLYNPNRLSQPVHEGAPSSWDAFDTDWETVLVSRKLAILTEPTTSPAILASLRDARKRIPALKWYQHTALGRYDFQGRQADYHFQEADVVLFVGTDCLFAHPAALRYARQFADRRTGETPNRVYAIEPTPTLTGIQSDWRLASRPERIATLLSALNERLAGAGGDAWRALAPPEIAFLEAVASDLNGRAPRALCVVGEQMPTEARLEGERINRTVRAEGVTLAYGEPVRSDGLSDGDLEDLSAAISSGHIDAVLVAGGNPAYDGSSSAQIGDRLKGLAWSAHLTHESNETTACCRWALPESHFLEAWSDLQAYDGTRSIVQPLVEPLHHSRSTLEIIHSMGGRSAAGYDIVRAFWKAELPDADEDAWSKWLRSGIIDTPARPPAQRRSDAGRSSVTAADGTFTLVLYPDPTIEDGRHASNPWLQELPKPLTKLVWDNALLLSQADADRLKVINGDRVRITANGASLSLPIWIAAGQADGCAALSLGGGRRTPLGPVGFSAYPLRRSNSEWAVYGVELRAETGTYPLVTTQHHFLMEGRDLVRFREVGRPPAPADEETTSIFPDWPLGENAWGMVIDLSACLGCNACVAACQAENNTPTVGKDEVSRGREMHWLRIDQYFEGPAANPRIVHQPVACMHCEKAPCELVCPVGATVHSSEGLNEMVYNRCVGTRYCSNNCPYKVRRFNFLDYRDSDSNPENLQKNPNVTVRARGVMEKCTYCVQRINEGRIAAEKARRPVGDGEIRTACQQACPSRAIVFGNLADPDSEVSRKRAQPGRYRLLEDQNTRPRTSYLPKMRYAEGGPS